MSAIHELTSIAPLQEFDLFTVPPTQVSVNDTYDVEYRPLAPVSSDTPIEFQIRSSENHYVAPSEIYLQLDLTIGLVNANDGSDTNASVYPLVKFRPVQNILSSIFKSVEIIAGGKVFKLQPLMYSYRAYFESWLGYDEKAKNTQLKLAGWMNDAQRQALVTPSSDNRHKKLTLIGRLFTDITHQKKSLLGGTKIDIRLEPNDVSFYTVFEPHTSHPAANYKAKAEFKSAVLHVNFQEATEFLRSAHNQALSRGTAKYPITHTDIRHFTVAKEQNDIVIPNAIQGNLPRRSFIFFVNNSAMNGSRTQDPFKLLDCKITDLHFEVDGRTYPTVPYKTDFKNKMYHKAYLDFLRTLDQNLPEPFLNLTYEQYGSAPVFVISFCPDLSSSCGFGGHVSPIQTNKHVTLKVVLAEKLEDVTSVILYNEYDDIIEFDSERTCVSAING